MAIFVVVVCCCSFVPSPFIAWSCSIPSNSLYSSSGSWPPAAAIGVLDLFPSAPSSFLFVIAPKSVIISPCHGAVIVFLAYNFLRNVRANLFKLSKSNLVVPTDLLLVVFLASAFADACPVYSNFCQAWNSFSLLSPIKLIITAITAVKICAFWSVISLAVLICSSSLVISFVTKFDSNERNSTASNNSCLAHANASDFKRVNTSFISPWNARMWLEVLFWQTSPGSFKFKTYAIIFNLSTRSSVVDPLP